MKSNDTIRQLAEDTWDELEVTECNHRDPVSIIEVALRKTTPTEAANVEQVDLQKLAKLIHLLKKAQGIVVSDEPEACAKCGCHCSIVFGMEATGFCHTCAQELLGDSLPILTALQQVATSKDAEIAVLKEHLEEGESLLLEFLEDADKCIADETEDIYSKLTAANQKIEELTKERDEWHATADRNVAKSNSLEGQLKAALAAKGEK